MLSARDVREFRGFLRNATDRQVQGIYDKEKGAGRDDYAELAVAEAERRGIVLELIDADDDADADADADADESSHSTKKTTPAPCVDVHFRVFPDGDVIALFPNDRVGGGQINSYQRLGQHGGASPALLKDLRKATRSEYGPLLTELKRIGYCLRVHA